jgi:hypothetical protein
MKDFVNTLKMQNPKMLVSENLFKKDNLEISANKGDKFELVIDKANESQCNVINHEFLADKFTSYIILNDKLGNDLPCKESDNQIKLSVLSI